MPRSSFKFTTSPGRRARSALSGLLMLLLLSGMVPLTSAQTGTSSVSGAVLDPEGRAVAGATVTLTSAETNAVRTQTTKDNGTFLFDLIPPGTYTLEAEAQGFKKAVITDVRALVAKPTTLDVQLEIGSIGESVTVTASSAEVLLNKQDATIGNNFVSQQIAQLPLESRNIVQLLSLQPGVTPEGYVAGSRADQANITLDGVDVNEQQRGIDPQTDEAFHSVIRVTTDTIEEFRVTTTNPNATQGRSSGAQVSLITKSGTNDFHGSLYWFHRNTVTSANDFFNNRQGLPTPKLLRNVYGGSFGGPIKRDKLFFFYGFEGRRDASEETVVRTVPLASLGRGEVRFPNTSGGITTLTISDLNQLFPVGVNPVAIAALADAAARYPANDDTTGDGVNTGGFRFNASTPVELETHTLKLDFNLNDKHSFFARGNYQQDVFGLVPQFPDTPAPAFWSHPTGLAVGHTWTINNNMVNSFRYGLTRLAFTNQGDSSENAIFFRFVFEPTRFLRTLSRTTPVHNFTDDFSYVRGNHNYQFGGNVRVIRNNRLGFATSFDEAVTNPSFYDQSGAVLSDPIEGIADGFTSVVQNAVSAVIGRFSQYTANFNFDRDGSILETGRGVNRTFATEEYDLYVQDSWKLTQNLTVTYGLRYGLSRPVYETNGFQVKPTVSLGDFFEQRKASAAQGRPFNDLITVDLAGPANGGEPFYELDKNNFQPRVAVAWSPSFKGGFLRKLFGGEGDSVFRGGFAITHDHIGQQLAVQFDLNNTLGFSSSQTIAANTYNVSDRPAPLFTGFGQDVRSLPGIVVPAALRFPLQTPPDEAQRIESSLDDTIITPVNYSWNASYGRKLPGGLFVEASYIGRAARNLLAQRDIMALNNLVDTQSGLDWYTAAGMLHDLRLQNTPISRIRPIAYFENLFPNAGDLVLGDPSLSATQTVYILVAREAVGGFNILDWTFVQLIMDDAGIFPNMFFHPQYAALATFSTVADSDYHAGTLSIRQRYKEAFLFDFNYTLSKSIDNASGLQAVGAYDDSAFILNPLRPEDFRAVSDFDIRHIINANALYQLPFGKGRPFLSNLNGFAEAILGGWQLTGIFRWNTGLPLITPIFDAAQWATNWNVQSFGVRTVPIESSPTRGGALPPKLFEDPVAAYRSFRNARPGETGDRNVLRVPGFVTLDMGLGKSFTMPFNENHKLQFRWEVFNVTNTQRLTLSANGVSRESLGLAIDNHLGTPPPVWTNLDAIQGSPRVMQFGFRYSF
ncbi:MAG TPA: TonB-dependent receptor [Blastocatellia bacterium]|nr:TonB-dependent receptor [Blastocatellia bacterium]